MYIVVSDMEMVSICSQFAEHRFYEGHSAVRDCLDAGGLIMRPLSAVNENL